MNKKAIAKVQVGDEILTLTTDFQWISDEENSDLAELANLYLSNYSYSPADGEPGIRHAYNVAERLKGKVIALIKIPSKTPEGVLF